MDSPKISRVVIAGGGTAGWMAAMALSHQLGRVLDITLVESDDIGTIGVGEATIPPMRAFHQLLKIDERTFMKATSATFKLGIQFEGWGAAGESYVHSFGRIGQSTWLAEFHHFWLRAQALGMQESIDDYCFELLAAKAGKFSLGAGIDINYAYHLDATAYAAFMRARSEAAGVKRQEGRICRVEQDPLDGRIAALELGNGIRVEGDFFIDCTGFRALLIEETLKCGYQDWSHWLPCDSAIALQTEPVAPPLPYTRSITHDAGWQWRIPLQHRVGNGIVYSSSHLDDAIAEERLTQTVEGQILTPARKLRFTTGSRRMFWHRNCLALGLASGFLEPLESTSIHLVMSGVTRFMQLFPFNGLHQALIDQYNQLTTLEMERVRDFIILHYHLNRHEGAPFWQQCREMQIPETLDQRIRLFREDGHAYQADGELFRSDSWVQVMLGQGLKPQNHHAVADTIPEADLAGLLAQFRNSISTSLDKLSSHSDFIAKYCPITQ